MAFKSIGGARVLSFGCLESDRYDIFYIKRKVGKKDTKKQTKFTIGREVVEDSPIRVFLESRESFL